MGKERAAARRLPAQAGPKRVRRRPRRASRSSRPANHLAAVSGPARRSRNGCSRRRDRPLRRAKTPAAAAASRHSSAATILDDHRHSGGRARLFGLPRRFDRRRPQVAHPAASVSTAQARRAASGRSEAPRSCAPRAAPSCDRVRRSGGRSPAASARSRLLERYIATCRGFTTVAVRRDERMSERLTL